MKKNPRGIISIVALAISGLIAVFLVSVQMTTMNSLRSIKNSEDARQAASVGKSATEYLHYQLVNKTAGFNQVIECLDEDFDSPGGFGVNEEFCTRIHSFFGASFFADNEVGLSLKIKGRAEDGEYFTNCTAVDGSYDYGFTADDTTPCYTIPLPGKGTAGERCNLYEPFPEGAATSAVQLVNHMGKFVQTVANYHVRQLDHSCNWNRIEFGSSANDRVAIPLYYTTDAGVVNPFFNPPGATPPMADTFIVRLRTPCEPGWDPSPADINPVVLDPTNCPTAERYDLDSNNPDVLVQWQITGTCTKTNGSKYACGIIGQGGSLLTSTELNGELINDLKGKDFVFFNPSGRQGKNVSTNPYVSEYIYQDGSSSFEGFLAEVEKPVLTFYLSNRLRATGKDLRYLEYQVVSDVMMGSPLNYGESRVNVNGNVAERVFTKPERINLVDFAVQN
ncbi:hypothetical protein CVV38_00855 [Candidatus Peregrinibacteria bacterium HGW-Peregrinibacteria-1]|jgi:hypothetical protein|nr:MAG: hypothetical protein CVV38_00855 [Candidatus Peregrinibacteria bacterium HGW-Peregrinibacteria-1]